MNSKKKNKNRQNKPPNLTPPQKLEVSESAGPPEVINAEIESALEERVPNIISETVAELKESPETPKKPKRNRGKKKKEDDKSDKEEEGKIEESLPKTGTQPSKDSLDEDSIIPTTRKKKHKNKKGQGCVQEDKLEESHIQKDSQLEDRTEQPQEAKIEETEQELKTAKKTNKKKKNRNDSERSEKAEELSCTSAFQKLLAEDSIPQTVLQPPTDDSSILEATFKKVEKTLQADTDGKSQETLQKYESNKNKKKNKKDKKQPTIPDEPKAADQIQPHEGISAENIEKPGSVSKVASKVTAKQNIEFDKVEETMPSSSAIEESNAISKANVAKPVEKKKKGKVNEKNLEPKPVQTPLDAKCEKVEEVTVTEIENSQAKEATEAEALLNEDLDNIVLVPLTKMAPDWQEEVKIDEGNGPVIGCEDKNEPATQEHLIDTLGRNKNKKKSPKVTRKSDVTSSNLPTLTSKLEEPIPIPCSSSSKEQTELEPALNIVEKSDMMHEEKTQDLEDKKEHSLVTKDDDKKDKGKKSRKSPKQTEKAPGTKILPKKIHEISKCGGMMLEMSSNLTEQTEKVEQKQHPKTEIKPHENEPSSDDIIQIISGDKRDSKKNSPKSPRRNEMVINPVIPIDNLQPDITHIDETTLPVVTCCPDILTIKTEESRQIKPDVLFERRDSMKEEKDTIKIPEKEISQEKKKSSELVADIDIASCSKGTQESKQNVLNVEDIIIIQAEVVSDEKVQKGDTFIACERAIDKQKKEAKHDGENLKKRKKSPKPPQKHITKETKDNTDKGFVLETHGEIQMPATPKTQEIKLSPEVLAVELEATRMEPMPSPSDVTPDFIEYPRCSSEHLDSNNNMVIQEISYSDAKLEVPLVIPETPFIQSCNVNSPDLATSGIKVLTVESENKLIQEKTDLKSKVIEVSQDMEELRLSIEKSLAEFTSLEKTETAEGKQMEEEKKPNVEVKPEISLVRKESDSNIRENVTVENKGASLHSIAEVSPCQEPYCPPRKDQKGKGKTKKKAKQESATQNIPTQSSLTTTDSEKATQSQDKNEDTNKSEQKSGAAQGKEKKHDNETKGNKDDDLNVNENNGKNKHAEFESIENFEDAMTSSVDDVNKTFEMIANEANPRVSPTPNNPEINVIAPQEDDKDRKQEKQNPVSPPKNLLGHPDIPVSSIRTDYKKEKNKPPNYRQAKVKIKDANQVQIEIPENSKLSKESQTESKRKYLNSKSPDESISVTNQSDDYVYKYSFRKVFLQCACHVCKKDLIHTRVPCSYCNLIFYCNQKHKDEDYSQHQALCFAVSTIVHLKDQKFIYADARDVTGHNYRLLRMQMIVSCEKVLKRRLAPWEQEALLYPRMCGLPSCREWRQGKLMDCEGCGQISYCFENPDHLPKTHSRWCKSYNLYRGLVKHQQTQGRLEPKLPTRVVELSPLPDNINEVLASMYEEKIDMNDIEYAALTQLATAPLTALFCLQHRPNTANGITKKSTLTLHIVGAELQFEADVLNKWEVFLLHLVPEVKELRVVMVGPDLNPSNLPLELLGKIKLCENCQQYKRRLVFGFQDKRTYHEFWASEDFTPPDLVCAFNPSIQRSSTYNGKDTWPSTANCVLKLKIPFAITSYTLPELTSDLLRIQDCATVGYNVVCAPRNNSFASVRPDRNFISDDEAPLLFKNHCVAVVCGV